MGYVVDGYIDLSLYASGQEIPLGADTNKKIAIIQNVNNLLPIVEATIMDYNGLQAFQNVLSDGAPIIVQIGPGNGKSQPMNFRRFNNTEIVNGSGGDMISFTAQYDAAGIRNLQTEAYSQQSSNDAISAAVQKLGLQFSGTPTNDSQTWQPDNRPIGQWLRKVADHGYVDPTSAMALAVGTRGDGTFTMMYQNLAQAIKQSPIARIVSEGFEGPTDIRSLGVTTRSHSGTLNNIGGYSGSLNQINLNGSISNLLNAIVNTVSGSGGIDMSSTVKGLVAALPMINLPIDAGNTHANYGQAQYQNERVKMTFSNFVSVISRDYTNLRIFDSVQLLHYTQGRVNPTVSGNYLVHGRTQFASGRFYRELITLVSQGGNNA